eukprot:TRINITY_DN24665_c0_g1_i1.p1 TRINITY_DN24665_c0_g1~~TRINITY_DN24665_c0_g1_i1.p1  ORF type:complete len:234 (+),score=69.78 TRINITY_DN24665_c0_g1_i1:72-704(+)
MAGGTTTQLIPLVSMVLARMCRESDCLLRSGKATPSAFDSKGVPKVLIQRYLQDVVRRAHFQAPALVMMLVYADRLHQHSEIRITRQNVHRVVLAGLVLATKMHCDNYLSNANYSVVGGVTLAELNAAERAFLDVLGWELTVDKSQYAEYRDQLLHMQPAVAVCGSAMAAVAALATRERVQHTPCPPTSCRTNCRLPAPHVDAGDVVSES